MAILIEGDKPLLLSLPHISTVLPDELKQRLSDLGRAVEDTDWHVDNLYDFAQELGCSVLKAQWSRTLIDLNRPPGGEALYSGKGGRALCPLETFRGEALYKGGKEPGESVVIERLETYWRPYHNKLEEELKRLRGLFGYAVLFDAHSIHSRLPGLFEGTLTDLNIGTASGASCASSLQGVVNDWAEDSPFSSVLNGRFIGGYITRHYGAAEQGIHALQLELAQCSYMNESGRKYEESRASLLK